MYDLKISGARVLDGSGADGFTGEVLVKDGMIAAVGPSRTAESAAETLDGDGLVLCPGFIDLHSHSDFTLFSNPGAESKVHQGVTTEVIGNCGAAPYPVSEEHTDDLMEYLGGRWDALPWSWSDLAGYLVALQEKGVAVNTAALAAHGTLRIAVMGFEDRPPTQDELEKMKSLLRSELEAGAFGLSTGLIYAPGVYSDTEELVALVGELAGTGAFHATHLRGESEVLLDAVGEAIHIGMRTGVPLHIAHLKAAGEAVWGASRQVVDMMNEAREKGLDVTGDAYPYLAGSTGLAALLPPWTLSDGMPSLLERLRSEEVRRRIASEIEDGIEGWWNPVKSAGGWNAVMITGVAGEENAGLRGMRVSKIAEQRGTSHLDAACDLLVEEKGGVSMIIFMMNEEDVEVYLAAEGVAVGTDGSAVVPGAGLTHPRAYGTFPRVLGRYVREKGLLSLPEAVHKMTGLAARRLGLGDRGLLRPGSRADLVLFSPDDVIDTATYENPHSYPRGIEYVVVNGTAVISRGEHTGERPGQVLRRPD